MSYGRNVYDDHRFTANHFCISHINAEFLKAHNINLTVKEFKALVKKSRWEFLAPTGSPKRERWTMTKVYNIQNFAR
jgi:hypothetical protein